MHISEWIEIGSPKDVWFTIIRQLRPDNHINENTPDLLANLIKQCLQTYGDFETRQCQFVSLGDFWLFEDSCKNKFILAQSMGIVNGEEVPVIAACIEAKIIDQRGLKK